jgi:dCMP deaminase
MKQKFIDYFMAIAEQTAKLSSAKRLQVGSIIVKDDRIISIGYNGMPPGWTHICEEKVWDKTGDYELKTKPEVLHAETNAIAKLARSNDSGLGATMFITHAPCLECAKLIYQSGINSVYYSENYRNNAGIDFLKQCNISVDQCD